jgi:hypothetical protein
VPLFNWTISIGNLLTIGLASIAAVGAWKDLTWRIKRLEEWRVEHMIDACARDNIIAKLDRLLERWDQREKDREQAIFERRQRRSD